MILKAGDRVRILSDKEGKRGCVAIIESIKSDSCCDYSQISLKGKFEYFYESGEVRFLKRKGNEKVDLSSFIVKHNEGFNFFDSEKDLVKWIKESLCDNDINKDEIRIYKVIEHYEAVMSLNVKKI